VLLSRFSDDWDRFSLSEPTIAFTRNQQSDPLPKQRRGV
jgi:hypothetical protein